MIARLIHWSIHNRFLVLAATVLLMAWGVVSVLRTPLDALPDLSDTQVIIRTTWPGQAPQLVENQVTYPMTTTMLSVPGAEVVRGFSFFGDSYVYVLFEQHPDMVWGLVAALFIGNFMLLVLNVPLVGLFARMLQAPSWFLMPMVVLIAFVGVYSLNNSPFDLYMMLAFGVLGYVLRKLEIPTVPVVLGLLLGGQMEFNLRRAMSISGGEWGILVNSGISVGIYVFSATLLMAGLVYSLLLRRRPG